MLNKGIHLIANNCMHLEELDIGWWLVKILKFKKPFKII
jgi:hypothetical protein